MTEKPFARRCRTEGCNTIIRASNKSGLCSPCYNIEYKRAHRETSVKLVGGKIQMCRYHPNQPIRKNGSCKRCRSNELYRARPKPVVEVLPVKVSDSTPLESEKPKCAWCDLDEAVDTVDKRDGKGLQSVCARCKRIYDKAFDPSRHFNSSQAAGIDYIRLSFRASA